MTALADRTDLLRGQSCPDAHNTGAPQDPTSPQADGAPIPTVHTPAGTNLPEPTTSRPDPKVHTSAREQTTDSGQSCADNHITHAAVGSDSPIGQQTDDAQSLPADGGPDQSEGRAANGLTASKSEPLLDPSLSLASLLVDDLEAIRIAEENRLRSLTDPKLFGLTSEHPDMQTLGAIITALAKVEHDAILHLNRTVRRHPLGEWAKAQKGIGEKTFARFLATLGGDPYVNHATGEIRTVSQLWAYCGHGDPARRKRKGMSQDDLFKLGTPEAKKRLYLIATTCLKAQGNYAQVYYARRGVTADRTHAAECVRCGPSGKPAQPDSPWSAAHQHADALRIVGKEILRDLWTEAKRIHEAAA